MSCSLCTASGSLYYFSEASVKCSKCVRRDVQYNGNFLADNFDRLHAEQEKLERARQDALERAAKDTAAAVTLRRYIKAL
jgi:hypothetical protein